MEPIEDEETIARIYHESQWNYDKNWVKSVAFTTRPLSVMVVDRLPGADAEVLHRGRFSDQGRVEVLAKCVRRVAEYPFTVDADPEGAVGDMVGFEDQHAVINGPGTKGANRRLAKVFQDEGSHPRMHIEAII